MNQLSTAQPTPELDRLSDALLTDLTTDDVEYVSLKLFQLTGIEFGYENFDDFDLTIVEPGSERYVHWPIPALKTVREVLELAERLHAATGRIS